MIGLNNFIQEKLVINKNSKVKHTETLTYDGLEEVLNHITTEKKIVFNITQRIDICNSIFKRIGRTKYKYILNPKLSDSIEVSILDRANHLMKLDDKSPEFKVCPYINNEVFFDIRHLTDVDNDFTTIRIMIVGYFKDKTYEIYLIEK